MVAPKVLKPKDPETPEQWQEAADLANFFLELESCRMYGLIEGGPRADIERCDSILNLARKRGIHPRKFTGEEMWGLIQELNNSSSSGS
jgi:hypothetical protein